MHHYVNRLPHKVRLDNDIRSMSIFPNDKVMKGLTQSGYDAFAKEDFRLAISIYGHILDLKVKQYGDLHCKVADAKMRLAYIQEADGNNNHAIALKAAALSIYKRISSRKNRIKINDVLTSIGNSYVQFGDLPQALDCYRESLEITEEIYGDQPLKVSHALDNIGSILALMGKYQRATGFFERALDMREDALGKYSVLVADTKVALGEVLFACDKEEIAALAFRDAVAIYNWNQYRDHPKMMRAVKNLKLAESSTCHKGFKEYIVKSDDGYS
uniref:MalT-like TPR region domain-containing protein n=1 Tax=Ditylum brightwellii TaxID=49249 RepID=A0A7S2E9U5_9STRA